MAVDRKPELGLSSVVNRLMDKWQENLDISVAGLQAKFVAIGLDLEGDYNKKREAHLKGTFINSAELIEHIGFVELVLKRDDQPLFNQGIDVWKNWQVKAIEKGYKIKALEDYIYPEPA